MSLLKIDNLSAEYVTPRGPLRAVRGVSFEVKPKEILGLVGESGCGKSTIGFCLLRLLPRNGRITSGSIHLDGEDMLEMDDAAIRNVRWRRISMIFQGAMNALNPVVRVGDLIVEVLRLHEPVARSDAQQRVVELFEMVGLPKARMSAYPHELSGGMRQRVAIALSLICKPGLVIADEPTTAFDVVVQDQVLAEIENLQQQMGLGIILITHDIAVVSESSHRMAVMYAGEIVEEGTVESVFSDPRHPYTRALIASVPSLKGARRQLIGLPGNPPDLIQLSAGCPFIVRCSAAKDICSAESPMHLCIDKTTSHFARCHFSQDLKHLETSER